MHVGSEPEHSRCEFPVLNLVSPIPNSYTLSKILAPKTVERKDSKLSLFQIDRGVGVPDIPGVLSQASCCDFLLAANPRAYNTVTATFITESKRDRKIPCHLTLLSIIESYRYVVGQVFEH